MRLIFIACLVARFQPDSCRNTTDRHFLTSTLPARFIVPTGLSALVFWLGGFSIGMMHLENPTIRWNSCQGNSWPAWESPVPATAQSATALSVPGKFAQPHAL